MNLSNGHCMPHSSQTASKCRKNLITSVLKTRKAIINTVD